MKIGSDQLYEGRKDISQTDGLFVTDN
jgi:hypothetical protein